MKETETQSLIETADEVSVRGKSFVGSPAIKRVDSIFDFEVSTSFEVPSRSVPILAKEKEKPTNGSNGNGKPASEHKHPVSRLSRTVEQQERDYMLTLMAMDKEIEDRDTKENPERYGMPDMMFKQENSETDREYRVKRESAVRGCVQNHLYIIKDGRKVIIKLIPEMVELITDLLYGYVSRAILWKPRGGGGSLTASLIIWLMMVYRKKSFLDMGSSGTQAKVVYEYVCQFWNCVPALSASLLKKEPLLSETRLINGVILKCSTTSELQTRGKHLPGFIADESSTDVKGADRAVTAGMQGSMSEPEHTILLLSTFHHPVGLFQEFWDLADEKGFKQYKWDIFDVMAKCVEPIECMTCVLTEKRIIKDPDGNTIGEKYIHCAGKARNSQGFMPFKNVIVAKQLNKGTRVFEVEFACVRPEWDTTVWETSLIDGAECETIEFGPERPKAIGIDWGLLQTAIILAVQLPDGVYIPTAEFVSGTLTGQVIKKLEGYKKEYGDNIAIYADASHPYNNLELERANFDVTPVEFNKWKEFAINNVARFLGHRRLFIHQDLKVLLDQMRGYRRNTLGKVVKKDDHGPDGLIQALLHFLYIDLFGEDSQDGVKPAKEAVKVF